MEYALLLCIPTSLEMSVKVIREDCPPAKQNKILDACSTAGTREEYSGLAVSGFVFAMPDTRG